MFAGLVSTRREENITEEIVTEKFYNKIKLEPQCNVSLCTKQKIITSSKLAYRL
jgi:hypothetical protein